MLELFRLSARRPLSKRQEPGIRGLLPSRRAQALLQLRYETLLGRKPIKASQAQYCKAWSGETVRLMIHILNHPIHVHMYHTTRFPMVLVKFLPSTVTESCHGIPLLPCLQHGAPHQFVEGAVSSLPSTAVQDLQNATNANLCTET